MVKYETIIVYSLAKGEEAAKEVAEKFKAMIEGAGTVESIDEWGKRRLAYEIKKETEGFYSFITFDAEPTAPAEIESRLRIMENVLRYLIIRKDA